MSSSEPEARLCVAGLAYFEVHLPGEVSEIPLDREIFVDRIDVGVGGAVNSASVASTLGIQTALAVPRGKGPTDAAIAGRLEHSDLKMYDWAGGDDPAISLIRTACGDRGFVSSANYEALYDCPPLIAFDWVHVPGQEEAHRLSRQLRRARSEGVHVSVCGSWAPRRLEALTRFDQPRWDTLIVNESEAQRAVGDRAEGIEESLSVLQNAAADVIVTRGSRPVVARVDDRQLVVEVPPADKIVDATGAGDGFAAGYIAARLGGADGAKAIERGIDVARTIVGLSGGVVDDPEVFDELP